MKRIVIKQILLALCIACSNANGAGAQLATRIKACLEGAGPAYTAAAAKPAATAAAKFIRTQLTTQETELKDALDRRYNEAIRQLALLGNATPQDRIRDIKYFIGRHFSSIEFGEPEEAEAALRELNLAINIFSKLPRSEESDEILNALHAIQRDRSGQEPEEVPAEERAESPKASLIADLSAEYQYLTQRGAQENQIKNQMTKVAKIIISRYANKKEAESLVAEEILKLLDLPSNPENEAILYALTNLNDELQGAVAEPTLAQELQGVWKGKDWEHHKRVMGERE